METRKERIEIRISKEEKKKLEDMARQLEIPASTLARNLMLASYDDMLIMDKLGVLKGIKKLKEFKQAYSDIFRPKLDLYGETKTE